MKKIPDGCIEVPLEEVDYIYQPPQSHTPVIVMKQKLPPMQSRVLECMKCGSKKNLNTNKDKSFMECDECMWGNDKPEKQEEWEENVWKLVEKISEWYPHYLDEDSLLGPGAIEFRNGREVKKLFSELVNIISQLLEENIFTKEELEYLKACIGIVYDKWKINGKKTDAFMVEKLRLKISKLLKGRE